MKDVQGAFSDVKFGAAYSYRWREDDPRWLVLFSENGGRGLFQLETDAEMLSVLQEKYQKFNARLAELARERVSSGEPSRPLTPPRKR